MSDLVEAAFDDARRILGLRDPPDLRFAAEALCAYQEGRGDEALSLARSAFAIERFSCGKGESLWGPFVRALERQLGGAQTSVKTIKVRIAIYVSANGRWDACGFGFRDRQASDTEMAEAIDDVYRDAGSASSLSFIEATIPLPTAIPGTVLPAKVDP